jgi:hypothetical protein
MLCRVQRLDVSTKITSVLKLFGAQWHRDSTTAVNAANETASWRLVNTARNHSDDGLSKRKRKLRLSLFGCAHRRIGGAHEAIAEPTIATNVSR